MKDEVEITKRKLDIDLRTKIYVTNDYDIFRKKEGNRDISPALVNKLYRSIIENGFYEISILIVGDNMTLLDGQHRIEALKRIYQDTGILYKVKYIVSRDFDDLAKVISWQTQRAAWTTLDFARSYALLGNDNYQAYLKFREKYKTNHTVSMVLLSGGSEPSKHFRNGNFKVAEYSHAEDWALRLQSLAQIYDFSHNRKFVMAIVSFWKHPGFSHKDFMEKVTKFRTLLYNCVTISEFRARISELYNYRRRDRVAFTFSD